MKRQLGIIVLIFLVVLEAAAIVFLSLDSGRAIVIHLGERIAGKAINFEHWNDLLLHGAMIVGVFLIASLAYLCLYLRQIALSPLVTRIDKTVLHNGSRKEITDWNKDGQNDVANIRENHYKGDVITYASGILSVYYGDGIYLSDLFALQDPLLARLPAEHVKNWTIGHMHRAVPAGYRESIRTGINQVEDPDLREYLDVIWEITRSENLFAKERLQKIVDINLGKYDYLVERYIAKNESGGLQ